MKILIADDDDSFRESLKFMVAALGHEPVEAADGASAWEQFRSAKPLIVVSDWMMPGLDGLALCRKIREGFRGDYTYFILLTGMMTTRKDFLGAMEAGVDDFLTKPPDAETFRARLRVAERILSLTGRISRLESFLPICVYCRRIRREDGGYEALDAYLSKRSRLEFSHGICPACMAQHHPEEA